MAKAARMSTGSMSLAEFLATDFGDDRQWELVDGIPVAQASPRPAHSTIQAAVARHLGNRLDVLNQERGTRCRVLAEAGVSTLLNPGVNWRQPDLVVTCEPYDPEARLTRAPILVVEVLSPTDEAYQRSKLHIYAALPSVREILFLDSRAVRAELHRRGPDGGWPMLPETVEGDAPLALASVDLTVPLSLFYPLLTFG